MHQLSNSIISEIWKLHPCLIYRRLFSLFSSLPLPPGELPMEFAAQKRGKTSLMET
jgi:hypothetical protein